LLGLTIGMPIVAAIALFFAKNAVWMAVSLFISGMFGLIQSVCIWTFRQESTPAHLIGRVSGITGSMFKLGMPFAIFGSGFVAESLSPSVVFLCAAVLYAGILAVYRFLPLRRLP
jgi:hypothetical protein